MKKTAIFLTMCCASILPLVAAEPSFEELKGMITISAAGMRTGLS